MKSIVIGIMPQEKIRQRVMAIARGDYKPKSSEPKIWFTSMKSLAEVLSDDNRALLHVIAETAPESISALAQATGRKPGNLSRTLKRPCPTTASSISSASATSCVPSPRPPNSVSSPHRCCRRRGLGQPIHSRIGFIGLFFRGQFETATTSGSARNCPISISQLSANMVMRLKGNRHLAR